MIGASHLGLPVSTTHVSAGGIFGVGVSTGTVRRRIVMDIVGAWVLTLPTAALFAAVASRALPALP